MTNKPTNETKFLEEIAKTYKTDNSNQDEVIRKLAIHTFKPYISPKGKSLELGCDNGFMTSLIHLITPNLTVVDGSKYFIELAKKRTKNIRFIHSLFEDFLSDEKYDYIFATYVLEHVNDSIQFLNIARNLLSDNGLLFVVVPNARALSRQLARHMGLIDDLYALTQNDINHGHRRVYDRILLNKDIEKAGLTQISQGGLLLKPFADFQMNQLIDSGIIGEAQQEGLYKLGLEYPDLAGSLFSICCKN